MREVVESIQSLGMTTAHLELETAGKLSQFGSLNEVLTLCERVELTEPVIDWSHLTARARGRMRRVKDFREALDEIEKRLGTDAVKNLHCHFSRMEFTARGERSHHTMDEVKYGPPFEPLADLIAESDLKPLIISESPLLDVDSRKMRDMVLKKLE